MTTTEHRFGILVLPDADAPTLLERFHRVEELGFDALRRVLPDP